MTTVSVPVSVEHVVAEYERGAILLEEFTAEFVQKKIDNTVDKANSKWGTLIQSRLDGGALTPNLYRAVIAEAVLRVLRNPDGYRQESEGNYSYGRYANVAGGYLMFTSENVTDLTGIEVGKSFIGTAAIGIANPPR